MKIPENSLMGNVKHNTDTLYERTKKWTWQQYYSLRLSVEKLSRDKSKHSLQKLEQIAQENDIPHSNNMSKSRLVERLKLYLAGRQGDLPMV